jgi:integrase
MPRFPKPYFRTARKSWAVQIGKRQINLGPDKKAAFAEYHRIMAAEGMVAAPEKIRACELIDLFLDHVQRHKKPSTYEWYRIHLQSFVDHSGGVQVGAVKPLHVSGWLDSHANWGPSTRRGAITAVKRCWAWATEEGRIKANPLAQVKRPPMGRRAGMTDEETEALLAAMKSARLREFAEAMIDTGCRPGELSGVTAADIPPDGRAVVVRNKLGQRVVTLTEKSAATFSRLAAEHPEGPIFLSTRGKAWNRNSLRCAFRKLRLSTGIAGAVPYALRHVFGTRAIERGVDSLLVAELMGHKDTEMLRDHYAHHKAETLRKAAEKATGGGRGEAPPSSPPP